MTYAFNPSGTWTGRHQMTVNGKTDAFTLDDLRRCAEVASMKRGRAETILGEVRAAVSGWPDLASEAAVSAAQVEQIARTHRLDWG